MIRILALLLASPAWAGTPLLPPAEFDHHFEGKLTIVQVRASNVARECSAAAGSPVRPDAAGCAVSYGPEECIIYLATRTRRAPLEDILRHEMAHCNGWSGGHHMGESK